MSPTRAALAVVIAAAACNAKPAPEAAPEAIPAPVAKPAPAPAPAATPAAAPATAAETKPSKTEAAADAAAQKVMREAIGPLHIGMTAADAEENYGAPTKKKGKPAFEGEATQQWSQRWTWDSGEVLIFKADTKRGPFSLSDIIVDGDSMLKTKRGVTLGSPRKEVEDAYRDVLNADESNPTRVVAGSIYGGITFEIKDGRVWSIHAGAIAK